MVGVNNSSIYCMDRDAWHVYHSFMAKSEFLFVIIGNKEIVSYSPKYGLFETKINFHIIKIFNWQRKWKELQTFTIIVAIINVNIKLVKKLSFLYTREGGLGALPYIR